MKKLILIFPFALFILVGCSSTGEKKEEDQKEPIQKLEIIKNKKPLEVNYQSLREYNNKLIPLEFFEGSDIFPLDGSYSARISILKENDELMIGAIYSFKNTNKGSYSTYIGAFSKKDGMLKSYLVSDDREFGDNVKKKNYFEFAKKGSLIKFAMLEPVIIDNLEEGESELNNRKILYEVKENGEILATDTLEYINVIKFQEFIKKFKNNEDLTDYQEERYYSKFAEVSIQQVNYFEPIFSSEDILVFRVRWSISDQTLESIWVYTVYGEFKSSCAANYPFEDYGVKIKEEKFEVVDKKKIKISIDIDWEEYELIADDEAGFELGDKTVGEGEWSLYIRDDFTCELVEESVNKVKNNFLDFIEKLSSYKDVSEYINEPYYQDFTKIEFGRAMLEILYDTDKILVFRIKSEAVEARVSDEIWVYTKSGEKKSVCKAPYPPDAFGITIKDFSFKISSKISLQFNIYANWEEYEISESDEGYPGKGDLLFSKESKWILRIKEDYQCSFEEVEL